MSPLTPSDSKIRWLTVDPGENTGWALWEGDNLIESGQTALWELGDAVYEAVLGEPIPDDIKDLIEEDELVTLFRGIERIVCEDWRLYPWELKNMAWDQCRTARLIGALTLTARQGSLEFVLQPATIKERAEAAGAEALFVRPLHDNRHQNDAIRHGIYFLAIERGAEAVKEATGGHVTDAS